jgi:hypothetical protein
MLDAVAEQQLDPQLAVILRELIAHEPIFHRPELGTARADFERMTADDFWEIGASGHIYTRDFVLDLLEERHGTPQGEDLRPSDFCIRELSSDTYLLHYNLVQGARKTRRTTLWRRTEEGGRLFSTKAQGCRTRR